MGSITEYLNKIVTAVKGKDVRGAIHDAIKQVYDDAATGGDANMEVTLARGTEPTLNDRLVKMDEVAETANEQLATIGGKLMQALPQNPFNNVPIKIKPNARARIDEILRQPQFELVTSEDLGFPKNSFVMRNYQNALGGTNGTRDVRLVLYFKIQNADGLINQNLKIKFHDSIKSLISPSKITLKILDTIDTFWVNGATWTNGQSSKEYDSVTGVFTAGATITATSNGKYIGVEILITPSNTNNNETINEELYCVEYIQYLNNTTTLVDTRDHKYYLELPRINHLIGGLDEAFVYTSKDELRINFFNNVVGYTPNYHYVGDVTNHSAAHSNKGTKRNPVNLQVYAFGYPRLKTYLFRAGSYNFLSFSEQELRKYFFKKDRAKNLICDEGIAVIDSRKAISNNDFIVITGSYKKIPTFSTLGYLDNYFTKSEIINGTYKPHIFHEATTLNKMYTYANSLAEVENTKGKIFYDYTNDVLYVNFIDETDQLYLSCSSNAILNEGQEDVFISGLSFKGFRAGVIKRNNIKNFWLDRVVYSYPHTATELDCFDIDDSSGIFTDCEAWGASNDGFNFHGNGYTELYDCVSKANLDDGCSHHDSCTFYMQGGYYESNGKGGVTPAFGAKGYAVFVTTRDNKGGSSRVIGESYGGFVVLERQSNSTETFLTCYRCTSENDANAFMSAGGGALLEMIDCKPRNSEKGIANIEWDTGEGVGSVVDYNTTFTSNGINRFSEDANKALVRDLIKNLL